MSETIIRARVDELEKLECESIFKSLGLTTSEAVRLFIRQVNIVKGLPFELKLNATAASEHDRWFKEQIESVLAKVDQPGRVTKALSEHNLRNYDIALVMCWFVAERYIHDQWNKLIAEKVILGKRKEKLQGRDYTASVMTEILEMNGKISKSRYEALNCTRIVRNGIAHQFGRRRATKKESAEALKLVRELIEETIAMKFPFQTNGVPVHGV